jgi:two-component system CheB/CheR fusion protein
VTKLQTSQSIAVRSKSDRLPATGRGADAPFPVVAVGASAGGLEAFTKFLQVFPPKSGMAIIFVQHLNPTHKSMMVDLLAPHTKMPVHEATDGTQIEPDNVYVIAPGTYLAIRSGALLVSEPKEHHGARMPFDFLLRSLAEAYGDRAIGVVLSGTGMDGNLGVKAIKDRGGLVVVQDPGEAAQDGMPQSAIDTGVVDLILPIEKIPSSLTGYAQQMRLLHNQERPAGLGDAEPELSRITDLLRLRAAHDFTSYKPGTLMRRIKRRMAIHAIDEVSSYLALLLDDAKEIDILAQDLLIHVTSFFRDAAVFELLAAKVIPELVRQHPAGQPIRVWVPACSSGEEVYSLAMIFLEEIAAAKKNVKLQMFGSDIDEQAVAAARNGVYPASLKAEISPERLARFFIQDAGNYRVASSLRETVIFTVQDLLIDPPFAQIDFVSCRNLLIYLLPEVQQRVLSLLHFALSKDGILLLGIAESIGDVRDDFEPISADLRVFRGVGSGRKFKPQFGSSNQRRALWPRPAQLAPQRDINLGELSQRLLLDSYAPASVLIDHKHEGLYYFGPTDNYLQIPSGDASHGLLAMVRQGLRSKLRTALQRARSERTLVVVSDGVVKRNGVSIAVRVEVRPVQTADKEYFLVSFVDAPQHAAGDEQRPVDSHDISKVTELEKIVEALQTELQDAGRELEKANADHEAINEEAQSLNEEYQSTNEELETSKEELQSLNEELTALNAQLTATVNQQRSTADDLENILRSSELAIVFLDLDLNIRFFSSAAKSLLNTIDADVGRPIGDLAHRFDDVDLVTDIRSVLKTLTTVSREIRSHSGDWYCRRVFPYRTQADATQGVVLTFENISVTKTAELKFATERAYADSVIDTVHQPLVVVDERLRVVTSNSSFCRIIGAKPDELVGRGLTAVGSGRLDVPAMNSFLDRARTETDPIEDHEIEIDLPPLGRRVLVLSSRKILGEPAAGQRILLAIDDITERKLITEALEIAKSKAEKANLGKSRFLAAASHDLRQPLQTLSLLHGVLARKVKDAESQVLIGKLDETLGAMSGMLNTLLDINQLEAGTVQPEIDDFAISTVLEHLKTEFTYLTKSKGISLHVVASSLRVRSDPLLLAQMIRNLLSNAVKYTKRGKILFGCRRDGDKVRLEIWDTGIGIPAGQLDAIFEEYHQLGNPARERTLGLGLGLSIVHRIGELLGHRIEVRSEAGKGSVFLVEVPFGDKKEMKKKPDLSTGKSEKASDRTGTILIIEDDPTIREALELLFRGEGYRTVAAIDGLEVAALVQRGALMPDVIIADYNLPGIRTGLEVIKELRQALSRKIPAIVLTGDIATDVLRKVLAADCGYLRKPVNVDQLTRRIEELIAASQQPQTRGDARKAAQEALDQARPTIFLVDDDAVLLESMRDVLQHQGHAVEIHASAESFLSAYRADRKGCLVVDGLMPGMSGLELLNQLKAENRDLPSIVITGHGDIAMAIQAMKAGAMDFIEKPARLDVLQASIDRALTQAGDTAKRSSAREAAAASIAALTPREREVMDLVVEGQPNKEIAFNLKISQRTVETHRAAVMKRTGVASLPDLIRLVMRAA